MDNYLKIYWLTRLDSIIGLLTTVSIICGVVIFVYWLCYFIQSDSLFKSDEKVLQSQTKFKSTYGKKCRLASWVLAISMILLTFMPTRNEAILIVAGGKTIDFIEKDKSINQIPSQTTAIVSKYLDETLKEMNKKQK